MAYEADLRIRQIGRPKISLDSALGLQQVSRRYVVEGPKVSKTGLNGDQGDNVPLLRPVGEADEEFTDHYLINQRIEPSQGMNKAYLVRDYAKLRKTWLAESVSETMYLKTLTRRYAVIRAQSTSLGGYDTAEWGKHPSQQVDDDEKEDANDPWDFLPELIQTTAPNATGNTDGTLTAATVAYPVAGWTATPPQFGVDGGGDSQNLEANFASGWATPDTWLPGAASVDTSNPGVDLWNVSYVAPALPFWALASSIKGGTKPPSIIEMDGNGFKVVKNAGGVTGMTAYTFTFFFTGAALPTAFISYVGGTEPVVSMDFQFGSLAGPSNVLSVKKIFKNAVFRHAMDFSVGFQMPDSGGAAVTVGTSQGTNNTSIIMKYPNGHTPADATELPTFQNQPFNRAGGRIDWDFGIDSSAAGVHLVNTKVRPVHSHGASKHWMVQLTYTDTPAP